MTLKELKNKIYAILDIDVSAGEGSAYAKAEGYISFIIDGALKKTALLSKCLKKSARLYFSSENGKMCAALPADFASFCYVRAGRVYGRECFEIISDKIRTKNAGFSSAELVYIAFPEKIDENTAEEAELSLPDNVLDTACYACAMEICTNIYPTDVQRYIRLATEYDERLALLISAASEAENIANGFFSPARGVLV